MTRVRKSPTILKPTIDENLALQFAAGSRPSSESKADSRAVRHSPASKPSQGVAGKNLRQIVLTLRKDLYDRIEREAARKDRTVEEHLIRHLTKRYDK